MAIESLPTFTKPARQRWESTPADIRQRLSSNVWCGHCSHETTITNFTGHPQITVPSGFLKEEPEAIHFMGGLYSEGKMCRIAKAYQDSTAWNRQQPPAFPA